MGISSEHTRKLGGDSGYSKNISIEADIYRKLKRREIIGAKAFQFKLKFVLDMRVRELEKVQQQFAVQQQKVFEVENLIQQAHQVLREQLIPIKEDVIDPVVSQNRFGYIGYLKQQIAHLQANLKQETQQLEKIRNVMKEAHIKKRSLELLEEKQQKNYLKHLEMHETKDIEDIVIAHKHRQNSQQLKAS